MRLLWKEVTPHDREILFPELATVDCHEIDFFCSFFDFGVSKIDKDLEVGAVKALIEEGAKRLVPKLDWLKTL